jgi:hypothetical protein
MSQFESDLGNAAIRVWGTILSGMKSFGGRALSAAKARAEFSSTSNANAEVASGSSGGNQNYYQGKFFSRSPPESGESPGRSSSSSATHGHDHGQ